jgi:glucokinase
VTFPFPVLLCDIGGTNVRYALASAPGARPEPVGKSLTADARAFPESALAALGQARLRPRSIMVCAAGPMAGRSLKLTNADWVIDGPAAARAIGVEQGLLLNDFEALAYALPSLGPQDARSIGTVAEPTDGLRLVLGPGTGLGLSALARVDGRYAALPSEAGHMGFGPCGPEEEAFWPLLERVHGRITAEAVLSGPGLARVHAARLAAQGAPTPGMTTAQITTAQITAAQITAAGLAAEGAARETLRRFWRLAARFAGDMAIAFLARGGVTLAGGVLPRLAPLLDEAEFRSAFEAKAPMDGLARAIPTRLVTAPDAVLAGMAGIAAQPERFAIDYAARLWV